MSCYFVRGKGLDKYVNSIFRLKTYNHVNKSFSILANYLGRSHDPLLDILEKGLDDVLVFIDVSQLDSSLKIVL